MQSVFTDRRAYVNALTYEFETSDQRLCQNEQAEEIDKYKSELATVKYPDGSKENSTFPQLEKNYNEIRDERTKLSLQFGEVLKLLTAARAEDGRLHLRPHGRFDAATD